jgi:GMP synthase-like glutamine amidotransferase
MLLLINNKRSLKEYTPSINTKLSSVPKLKRALRHLHLKFHEVKGIDEQLLNPSSQLHRQITGVIISGSSMKLSRDLDISQYVHILRYLQAFSHLPVLGICFGAQLLVCLYGGNVVDQGKYICEKLPVRILPRNPLFVNGATSESIINPMFCFSDLPVIPGGRKRITPIAWMKHNSETEIPVAFEFEKGQVYGCLFHPEWCEDTFFILSNLFRNA